VAPEGTLAAVTLAEVQPPERELAELREYLGDGFHERALADRKAFMADELARIGDEATLYRTSQAYLYDLTAFAMTGTKHPYLDLLTRAVPPPARVLDYGCGIGSDGLALLQLGYDVSFADFDNPSTRYLRWRLGRRGFPNQRVYDLDRETPPDGFDLAYSFDVIEHVDAPQDFLGRLEAAGRLVLLNLLAPMDDGVPLHTRALPVAALLRRIATRRVLRYRLLHERSHVVLYDRRRARGAWALRSLATLVAGRLAAR
jgi:SAM-dependent methyltransferase